MSADSLQNESAADYQTYLSEGEGTASEEWRQDRSLNTESPRLHAAMSGSLDSLRSSSGGVDVRTAPFAKPLLTIICKLQLVVLLVFMASA